MKKFKICGITFVIIFIIFILIYYIPWQLKINNVIQGVQSRIGDKEYSENVSIKINGIYKQYLFKKDVFEGTISINKYEFTHNVPTSNTVFMNGYANLIYSKIVNGNLNTTYLGAISCSSDFSKLLISISEPLQGNDLNWNKENGLFICAPAFNREEALEIAKKLSKNSKWFDNTKWN